MKKSMLLVSLLAVGMLVGCGGKKDPTTSATPSEAEPSTSEVAPSTSEAEPSTSSEETPTSEAEPATSVTTPVGGDALVEGVFTADKTMPSTLSYITNNEQYPELAFYNNGGLKLYFVGQGVETVAFTATDSVTVEITFFTANGNTKSQSNDDKVLTVTGLDASGAAVATKELKSAEISVVEDTPTSVALSGTGIVKVKVIMSDYYTDGSKCFNLNLKSIIVK